MAVPIGHASTTLPKTMDLLTAAFSTVIPSVERSRASRGIFSPATDHNAKAHDFTLFKSLLDSITDLVQSRLLVPPLAHRQAAQQQGATINIHRTPESIAIT